MLINADQLDTSPPEWLADGIIPLVGAGFVYGKRHWGKSLVVDQELGLDVANGEDFFGHKVKKGSVVVCLGEGLYDAGVRKQARLAREQQDRNTEAARIAAEQGYEAAGQWMAEQPPYTDESLFIITEPFTLPFGPGAGGEMHPSLRQVITQLKQIPDLQLVVLDSFADFADGLSISNDTSASRAIKGLKAMVRELDCCVIAVAHPTEDGKKMLGAGRLGNAADFVIRIEPDEGTAPGEPQTASLVCEKNKYGPKFEPFGYRIEPAAWFEPARDEETGELIEGADPVLITSATVRPHDDEKGQGTGLRLPGAASTYQPEPLPALTAVPEDKPRKRNGIRPRPQAFRATGIQQAAAQPQRTAESAPAQPPADERERDRLVSALISGSCDDCGAGPGVTCNPHVAGGGLVHLDSGPLVVAHISRISDAFQQLSAADRELFLAQFKAGNAPAGLAA